MGNPYLRPFFLWWVFTGGKNPIDESLVRITSPLAPWWSFQLPEFYKVDTPKAVLFLNLVKLN